MVPQTGDETRLLCKAEVIERVGVSYPTIWNWMRAGKFPRARDLNGSPRWLAHEVEVFLSFLPEKKYLPVQSNDAASTVVRARRKAKQKAKGGRNA
jgi:predicted DNA-binding transcriptional regulator AlpA